MHAFAPSLKAVAGVKNIIAIASGKGGVGKSTTTTNLAASLVLQGARVGILDADIYGPNQPHMLGSSDEKLQAPSGSLLQPRVLHGIQSMSMGYLMDASTPIIWRGPMVSSALQQLVSQTEWHDLDYLLIDLPPGTGDIQLTLAQKIPVTAAVIVTTPQDISLLDARKALEMFRKVNVPVLGVIENMSMHLCSACGHADAIFGEGGGERMAAECEVPLLGQLPLAKSIREAADQGVPFVSIQPRAETAQLYQNTARLIAAKLARQAPNYTVKFPRIVVE
jgi:ATP-binding protein involved in chromosome partitioning